MRRPRRAVAGDDRTLERLPGVEDAALGGVARLVRHGPTRVVADACRRRGAARRVAHDDLVIGQRAPMLAALCPDAQRIDVVELRGDHGDLAVDVELEIGADLGAGLGQGLQHRLGAEGLTVAIGPGELGIEQRIDRAGIALGQRQEQGLIGLADHLVVALDRVGRRADNQPPAHARESEHHAQGHERRSSVADERARAG